MKTKAQRRPFALLLATVALSGGCQGIMEDLARQPYEDAMRKGRMTQGEYQRMSQQIEQAANPPASAGRSSDKYK